METIAKNRAQWRHQPPPACSAGAGLISKWEKRYAEVFSKWGRRCAEVFKRD